MQRRVLPTGWNRFNGLHIRVHGLLQLLRDDMHADNGVLQGSGQLDMFFTESVRGRPQNGFLFSTVNILLFWIQVD